MTGRSAPDFLCGLRDQPTSHVNKVVGDDPESHPSPHSIAPVVAATRQPVPPLDHADSAPGSSCIGNCLLLQAHLVLEKTMCSSVQNSNGECYPSPNVSQGGRGAAKSSSIRQRSELNIRKSSYGPSPADLLAVLSPN